MKREFFCPECGLFFFADQYVTDETGRAAYNPFASRCPNPDCESHVRSDTIGFAVDTFGFAYFCESEVGKEALQKKWSAPEYAPPDAIEIYRRQGMRIVEPEV